MNDIINLERTHAPTDLECLEIADYLNVGKNQVYYVLHRVQGKPKAFVLLFSSFVTERPHRYIPWVRWARFLAASGYEVMRFDYRGTGESSGLFEEFGFHSREEDAVACLEFLEKRGPGIPVVLHGLGMGALITDSLFRKNSGDVQMLWLPAKAGRTFLYQQLRLRIANDFILVSGQKKTRDDYVRELESGLPVEVEGYVWTRQLWNEAEEYVLSEIPGSLLVDNTESRPQIIYPMDVCGAHMFGGVGPNPLRDSGEGHQLRLVNPDMSSMFADVVSWINKAIACVRKT